MNTLILGLFILLFSIAFGICAIVAVISFVAAIRLIFDFSDDNWKNRHIDLLIYLSIMATSCIFCGCLMHLANPILFGLY